MKLSCTDHTVGTRKVQITGVDTEFFAYVDGKPLGGKAKQLKFASAAEALRAAETFCCKAALPPRRKPRRNRTSRIGGWLITMLLLATAPRAFTQTTYHSNGRGTSTTYGNITYHSQAAGGGTSMTFGNSTSPASTSPAQQPQPIITQYVDPAAVQKAWDDWRAARTARRQEAARRADEERRGREEKIDTHREWRARFSHSGPQQDPGPPVGFMENSPSPKALFEQRMREGDLARNGAAEKTVRRWVLEYFLQCHEFARENSGGGDKQPPPLPADVFARAAEAAAPGKPEQWDSLSTYTAQFMISIAKEQQGIYNIYFVWHGWPAKALAEMQADLERRLHAEQAAVPTLTVTRN